MTLKAHAKGERVLRFEAIAHHTKQLGCGRRLDKFRRIITLRYRLVALPLEQRRLVTGLHPDRAPTIIPGVVILAEVMRLFGLDEVEVSEHDILRGAALAYARSKPGHGGGPGGVDGRQP